ncbi:FAD-binding oxidoreductase [Microbacterium sp. NPDC091313]
MSTTASAHPGEHLLALRAALHGELFLPGDEGWDDTRRSWQVLVDQRPVAVVVAADVDDVVATIGHARRFGLRVAPQATGHNALAVGGLDDTILLRTSLLTDVTVDPGARVIRVGAGVSARAAATAAAEHGLAVIAGFSPTVGIVGFSLGGGLGWLSRSHGLAANGVVAIEAVDAEGRVVRLDAGDDSGLFWAARGGSAPVVVTAAELRLHPLAELVAGGLMWPLERLPEVAAAWREWIATVPDGVGSLVRAMRFPPLPMIPEPLRGRAFAAIEVAIQDDPDAAAALLAPLRAIGPVMDSVRPMPPTELGTVHGDPEEPAPARGHSITIAALDEASVDAFVAASLAPSADALLSIEVRHLGGALRAAREGGAVSTVDAEGVMFAVGFVPAPEALEQVRAAASGIAEALRPYAAPFAVKNFVEEQTAASAFYPAETIERLRAVVAAADPEGRIRVSQPVG